MRSKNKRKASEVVLREGKPAAVILEIGEYRKMLERLEDVEDLKMRRDMRKRSLKFRKTVSLSANRRDIRVAG